jgi:hypothetical protein
MKNKLQTIDGDTLLNTPLPATRSIASNFIPEGLAIFGGVPKIVAYALALLADCQGENLWNFKTHKGTTLYLCLEDSYQRIQSRLAQITDEAPENTHFATMSGVIGEGLEEQIEGFIAEHPDTILIVIDTLQKIRRDTNSSNQYGADYAEVGRLQALAQKHHICIMLVHHLRKMKDTDPMNMLSGTTGLSGVADTIYVLEREKRTEKRAKLFCSGRDIETLELKLEFNTKTFLWEICDESFGEEVNLLDEVIETVHNYFLFSGSNHFCGTATELSIEIYKLSKKDIAPAVISKKLVCFHSQFCDLGYRLNFKRTHEKKLIEIDRICVDVSTDLIGEPTIVFGDASNAEEKN